MTVRTGWRASTIGLLLVLTLALAGLAFTDRTLRTNEKTAAGLDAAAAASLVQSFLAVHAVALDAMHALYVTADRAPSPEAVAELVRTLGGEATGFRRVWVTDSTGVVRHETRLDPEVAPLQPNLDVDTISRLGMRTAALRARATRELQVSSPGRIFTGEQGFALVEPMYSNGRFVGFAGGSVGSDALVGSIPEVRRGDWIGLVVTTRRGETVVNAHWADAKTKFEPGHATARVPNGDTWRVEVHRRSTLARTRGALWGVSLIVLAGLALGVLHDRRQAHRIAERSTELERLSTELLRANRAKSEFLANVSHELRTPLNAIVGFVDLLRDGVYGELNPRQSGPVQRIEASANHLRHLVDQILDLAKMAAGRLEVHTEILDLRPFVLDVVSEVESLLSEKGLSLSVSVGATLPRVRTDPTHLRQILVNLLGNAVKYTPTGGVSVRARLVEGAGPPDAGKTDNGVPTAPAAAAAAAASSAGNARWWIALGVADTGIGIAEGDRARVFEEFEQVNAGPRGESMARGTGLGLPISRRLSRLLGGDVTVDSAPGKGSVFTLWLPVHPADLKERHTTGSGRAVASASGN